MQNGEQTYRGLYTLIFIFPVQFHLHINLQIFQYYLMSTGTRDIFLLYIAKDQ